MIYYIQGFYTLNAIDDSYYKRFAYRLGDEANSIGWSIAVYARAAHDDFVFRNGRPKYETGWVWL